MIDLISRESIEKGWSCDRKYRVVAADGTPYLLRITPKEKSASRKGLFRMLNQVQALGIPMCRPVDFHEDETGAHMLLTWIDGEDAENVIPCLSDTEQYALGLDAGRILKRIHGIPAPDDQPDWETRFTRKADAKIRMYRECPIKVDGMERMVEYINANRHLLKNRPQCFQHGDYHIGNMMIDRAGGLQIIDFDRYDFGDPWEEFNRIVWCAQKVPQFATGMVDGYFGGTIPSAFWRLLALYISSNTLGSIPWAIPFGQEEIDTMVRQAREVLEWYDGMQNPMPSWYAPPACLQYVDGLPCRLKSPFDFGFLREYGRVFKIFDDQDSGNICFGTEQNGRRFFVKFAGAPTVRGTDRPANAIARLKASLPAYRSLRHPHLIDLVEAKAIGGGFAMIFRWAEGDSMGRAYPAAHRRFMALPIEDRLRVFSDVLDFLAHVADRGYVAVDFYDGSILYDAVVRRTTICDVDFFAKRPFVNPMGRMWGSSRFMSPEEFEKGAIIDEITNVYAAGAMAFALFGNYMRTRDAWQLSDAAYKVALKAVSPDRTDRFPSIRALTDAWNRA